MSDTNKTESDPREVAGARDYSEGVTRPLDWWTIPDAFHDVPKIISPRTHAWVDVGVTAYFVALGAWFFSSGKKGPAGAALLNAAMVAGVSAFTDYEGTGEKPITFKMHATLDALQALTAAIAPTLHGFVAQPEAAFFYGQALNELGVIAATDWDRSGIHDTGKAP